MIGKITKGKGFRGLADYLLRDGRGEIVAGPMAGVTPRELAAEFGQLRRLNPKLGRAVAHFSLRPSPADPPLTADQWQAIAARFMADMGFAGAPWCAVVHRDTDHTHLHVIACRIDQAGKTIADANDFRRAEAAIRRIEADFGLAAVASPEPRKARTAKGAATAITTIATTEEPRMTDTATTAANALDPSDLQSATLPEAFEPGRDLAEIAAIETGGSAAPSAMMRDDKTERQRRNVRRITAEDDYSRAVLTLFGDDLARVFKHPRGAILYFHRPASGEIADAGDKLTALHGMPEEAAAKRIVALATSPGRAWKCISFTGSDRFIELAMREAMAHRITIHTQGPEQVAILARLMAEQQGAMGSSTGPANAQAVDPILAPLSELDDRAPPVRRPLPLERPLRPEEPTESPEPVAAPPAPASTPPKPVTAPVEGVAPFFRNLGDRLKDRRQQQAPTTSTAPHSTGPKAPGRTGL